MTFAGLASSDFEKIARAEATRRIAAAKNNPDVTAAQRQQDERTWSLIVRRARWFSDDRPPLPFEGEDMAATAKLAATVLRTTQAALRKWRDEGKPGGEPEARAFLLFSLARKFAELTGDPRPYVDGDGAIYFLDQKDQAA